MEGYSAVNKQQNHKICREMNGTGKKLYGEKKLRARKYITLCSLLHADPTFKCIVLYLQLGIQVKPGNRQEFLGG